jgi:hypothetical protein
VSVYRESGIDLDLTAATAHEKHDAVNRVFGGVDFVIDTGGATLFPESLWLEMKSWSPSRFVPRKRGGQRRSFLAKVGSGKFTGEFRGKFLGTCSFLTLTGAPPTGKIVYAMLLESDPGDSALRSHLMARMRGQLPTRGPANRPWSAGTEIHVAVLDVNEWNARYAEFPATLAS